MKKIALTVILLVSISTATHAQINVGLKLNCTINRFIIKKTNANEEFYFEPKTGIQEIFSLSGGVIANYKLNHLLSIQSELIFDAYKTNFAQRQYYTNQQDEIVVYNNFNINMDYLEIPCLAKISFGNEVTFDILSGGYIGYLLSAKQLSYNGKLNIPQQLMPIDYPPHNVRRGYTSFNAGVLLGCSVTMHDRAILELRLNRGLIDINKSSSAKFNTLHAQFTVAYYFFRQKTNHK